MKKKIVIMLIIIVVAILIIVMSLSTEIEHNIDNRYSNITEIQPEEEISEEQNRLAKMNLYFVDSNSGVLCCEERKIDSKNLIDNPYKYIISLLMNGPETEGLTNAIPSETKVNGVVLNQGILVVDLSKEFLNSNGTDSIYEIVNTLSQFNEVEGVKFKIDGEVKDGLKEIYIKKNWNIVKLRKMLYNNTVMERIDDLQYENLKIIQNPEWFCFGVDSVLLTEFARDIKRNSRIIDLGTGTGILSILMSKKVNAQKIVGVELQGDVAEMATRSVKINGLENIISIVRSDLKDLKFENNSFDVVITNPPYKKAGTGIDNKNEKQRISRYETTANLDEWLKIASRLLKDFGSFYMVYRTDRLTELIENMKKYKLEIKRMRFVYSNEQSQSNLVLIKAVKGAKVFAKIEKPLIIYNMDGTYTDEIMQVYNKK